MTQELKAVVKIISVQGAAPNASRDSGAVERAVISQFERRLGACSQVRGAVGKAMQGGQRAVQRIELIEGVGAR